jgi:hydroxymethylbilane synthase
LNFASQIDDIFIAPSYTQENTNTNPRILKMATQAPPSAIPASQKIFTIGTRKSKLALLQTDLVLAALKGRYPEYEFKIHSRETAGDQNTTIALRDFTTKNLWTQELEDLLEAGHVDLIVHSLKGILL